MVVGAGIAGIDWVIRRALRVKQAGQGGGCAASVCKSSGGAGSSTRSADPVAAARRDLISDSDLRGGSRHNQDGSAPHTDLFPRPAQRREIGIVDVQIWSIIARKRDLCARSCRV